jgi:hypothetical protein
VLTAGHDQTARIWDAASGNLLTPPLRHSKRVARAAWSPDGKRVVTAGYDHAARVWDASTGHPLTPPLLHSDVVSYAEFSPDGRRVVTASWDGTAQTWEFESADTPVDDLRLLAQVLSGRRIESSVGFAALEPLALKNTFNGLRKKCPYYFSVSSNAAAAWHRRESVKAIWSHQFFAARFHLRQIEATQPKGASAEYLRARLAVLKVPARGPEAPPNLIDLSDYYNGSLVADWRTGRAGDDLAELPRGVQMLAGVAFDVRGVIQLGGGETIDLGRRLPNQVTRIKVGRHCQRVHFLHGALWENAAEGTQVGQYLIRYENGHLSEIPIRYGYEVRNWWSLPDDRGEVNNAEIAWTGQNPAARKPGATKQLYKVTWTNPFPNLLITSIDFTTHQGPNQFDRCFPFLIAISMDD